MEEILWPILVIFLLIFFLAKLEELGRKFIKLIKPKLISWNWSPKNNEQYSLQLILLIAPKFRKCGLKFLNRKLGTSKVSGIQPQEKVNSFTYPPSQPKSKGPLRNQVAKSKKTPVKFKRVQTNSFLGYSFNPLGIHYHYSQFYLPPLPSPLSIPGIHYIFLLTQEETRVWKERRNSIWTFLISTIFAKLLR